MVRYYWHPRQGVAPRSFPAGRLGENVPTESTTPVADRNTLTASRRKAAHGPGARAQSGTGTAKRGPAGPSRIEQPGADSGGKVWRASRPPVHLGGVAEESFSGRRVRMSRMPRPHEDSCGDPLARGDPRDPRMPRPSVPRSTDRSGGSGARTGRHGSRPRPGLAATAPTTHAVQIQGCEALEGFVFPGTDPGGMLAPSWASAKRGAVDICRIPDVGSRTLAEGRYSEGDRRGRSIFLARPGGRNQVSGSVVFVRAFAFRGGFGVRCAHGPIHRQTRRPDRGDAVLL